MRSNEHRVGKQTTATVQHCQNVGGTIHMQMRPQETPPAKIDSKDKGRGRVYMVQRTDDMLPLRLDGCAADTQGAPQPMPEESQGSRS